MIYMIYIYIYSKIYERLRTVDVIVILDATQLAWSQLADIAKKELTFTLLNFKQAA